MNPKNQKYNQKANSELVNSVYGKLPPQAIEVEEAVLGSLMLERDAIHKVTPIISGDCFYKEEHQIIYQIIRELADEGRNIDLLVVTQRIKDKSLLDKVGGPGYITQLTRRVASAAHIEHHARIIHDKYVQREMIRRFSELINKAYEDDSDDLELMYAMHTQAIDELMAGNMGMMHIREILVKTTKDLEERQAKAERGEAPGIPTGLADLNRYTKGWQRTDLIIIAARPSMGKTAIALHFARSAGMDNKNVCIFSLEMDNLKLSKRLALSYGGIDRERFDSGTMIDGDWQAYHRAVKELEQLPIYIDDTAGPTVRYIEAVVRNKVRKGECDLVVIDYLQLVESQEQHRQNREREVAEISRGLKKVAKAANVPVILLGQLNRAVENREDKKPRLADLRESGAIEQDADVVIFPWRPEYYGIEEAENGDSLKNVMFLEIEKNREGRVGTIVCTHNGDLTQFYDYNYRGYAEERF